MALDTAPKLNRKRVLAIGLETTNGTMASLTGSNATYPAQNVSMPFNSDDDEREEQDTMDPPVQGVGATDGTAEWEYLLGGSGASGSAPLWVTAARACGMSLSGSTLSPVDAATETLSAALYRDGRVKRLAGCMGNFVITATNGRAARMRFSMRGVPQRVADAAILAPTWNTTIPPRVGAATFTIEGTTYRVNEVTIDRGAQVILREDITGVNSDGDPTGYRAGYITRYRPIVRCAPEALPFATADWYAMRRNSTTVTLALTIGASANNRVIIAAPEMQLVNFPQDGDRNGMLTDELEFLCTGPSSLTLQLT